MPWAVGVLLLAVLTGQFAQAETGSEQDIPDAIVNKVDPSVVAIQHERAVGSGFIISKDGYILSNGHVVRGSDNEDPTEAAKSITVILNDERKFPARVLGFCMNPDVALLKIDCDTPLSPVEYGDSRNAHIGQKVFAVGTPHGLKRTFSGGILSNVDRTDLGTFTKVIQTDAAINPGNSGGPLFDREGRVLGLNTYGTQGANNIGFTIPIHVAEEVRKDIMEHGRFVRSDVPCFSVSELYDEMRTALGVDGGVLVDYVMENTPAYQAGLRAGDVLTVQNGKPIAASTQAELKDMTWEFTILEPGTPICWTALRKEGDSFKEITINAITEQDELMPSTQQFPGEIKTEKYDTLGLSFKEIVRAHRLMYRLQDDPGVLVSGADKGTPAERAGLRANDIITYVNGTQVTNVSSFRRTLEARLAGQEQYIDLTIQRGKLTERTVLAPYYDLKGKNAVVVAPPGEPRYLELVLRELISQGATLTLASSKGDAACSDVAVQSIKKLSDLTADDIDLLLLLDGDQAKDYRQDETVMELIRDVHTAGGTLAAIGTSAITLVVAEPTLLEKKMTTCKDDSSEAIQRKAQYTGSAVEKDEGLVTTTGIDRQTVRNFLKEVGRASGTGSRKTPGAESEPAADSTPPDPACEPAM